MGRAEAPPPSEHPNPPGEASVPIISHFSKCFLLGLGRPRLKAAGRVREKQLSFCGVKIQRDQAEIPPGKVMRPSIIQGHGSEDLRESPASQAEIPSGKTMGPLLIQGRGSEQKERFQLKSELLQASHTPTPNLSALKIGIRLWNSLGWNSGLSKRGLCRSRWEEDEDALPLEQAPGAPPLP